jgi:hypothetical protein
MKYVVIYEKTSTGCVAAGDLLMERAIEIHLASMREDGDAIPEPTTAAEYLEVPAA